MKRFPIALVALLGALAAAAPASAATISGTVKGGKGLQVVVVQANGKGKKATLPANGSFRIAATVKGASLHLVSGKGAYLGPVILGGGGTAVYATLSTARGVDLGTISRKPGYAKAAAPMGSYYTTAAYTATARSGKPIGAGNLGRVKVGNGRSALKGYNGQGSDADLDGVVGAFDTDDNGNLILDNVDRTTRKGKNAGSRSTRQTCGAPPLPPCDGQQPPAPGPVPVVVNPGSTTTDFRMFSNFKLTGAASINLYLAGTAAAVQPLIDQAVPTTVTLATQVVGGSTAKLDCLGNVYCAPHVVGSATYPLVNSAAASVTGSVVDIATGTTGDAQITPGAAPSQIGAGNAFLQIAGGSTYPGVLNFVFNTAPAVYSVTVGGTETVLTYDAATGRVTAPSADYGMTPANPIAVGADGIVTLKWFRPQRPAAPGEPSASGYVDMGALLYTADAPNKPNNAGPRTGGNNCAVASYSAPVSNGSGFALDPALEGVLDPAADTATDPADPVGHLLQYTLNAATCFGADWVATAGATFDFDIQARSVYGDNAARKLYFRVS